MNSLNGKLILIGGTKNREENIEIFVETLSIVHSNKILIIPSAAPISLSLDLGEEYRKIFKRIKPKSSIYILDIKKNKDLTNERNINLINEVDFIFFTGGSQFRLNKILNKSFLLRHILDRFRKGEIDLAGTSAGASVMGGMIVYGENEFGENHNNIQCDYSFGVLPNVIIDSHVLSRNRIYRLAKSLVINPKFKALGLTEDTGLLISNDGLMKVFGKNPVITLSLDQNNNKCEDYKTNLLTIDELKMGIIFEGGEFKKSNLF